MTGERCSSSAVAVALFGVPHGAPRSVTTDLAPATDDTVGLSSGAAADLHVGVGDRVTITGTTYRVATVGGDAWYSHTPVVALSPDAWAQADRGLGGDGAPTVLAVSGTPDWTAAASCKWGRAARARRPDPCASGAAARSRRSRT